MSVVRTVLAALLSVAIAMAPLGAAVAAVKPPASAATDMSAMGDCHKAPAQASDTSTSGPCKHCDSKSGCTPDACAFKCFKLVADVPMPELGAAVTGKAAVPLLADEPPSRAARAPAPPPRA